jgi:hypothetical protein
MVPVRWKYYVFRKAIAVRSKCYVSCKAIVVWLNCISKSLVTRRDVSEDVAGTYPSSTVS